MKKNKLLAGFMVLTMMGIIGFQAVSAGTLSFATESDTVVKNCPVKVDIMIDTETEEVNSLDLGIVLNDTFEINDIDNSNGIMRTYSAPKTITARKGDFKDAEIMKILVSTSSPNGYIGKGKLLTLTITPKADNVDLQFYMIPGEEGEDSNLMVKKGDNIIDVLSTVDNITLTAIEGECTATKLEPMTFTEPETTVLAEEVVNIVEETTDVIKENIFDETQETNWLKENRLYVAIVIVAIILLLVVVSSKKKKK